MNPKSGDVGEAARKEVSQPALSRGRLRRACANSANISRLEGYSLPRVVTGVVRTHHLVHY